MIKQGWKFVGLGLLACWLTACGTPSPAVGGFTPYIVVITPSPTANATPNRISTTLQPATTPTLTITTKPDSPVAVKTTPVLLINNDGTYTVKSGDTLLGISIRLGVDLNDIVSLNNLDSPDKLQIGQILKIPPRKSPTATRTP